MGRAHVRNLALVALASCSHRRSRPLEGVRGLFHVGEDGGREEVLQEAVEAHSNEVAREGREKAARAQQKGSCREAQEPREVQQTEKGSRRAFRLPFQGGGAP